jgi:hypothetical protein
MAGISIRKFFVLALLALLAASLILLAPLPAPALAAQPACQHYHLVKPGDTLRSISQAWKVAAWDLVAANRAQMTKPNYPVFLGTRLCIPEASGTARVLPAWVLDQPPAQLIARAQGKSLAIDAYNFPLGSNWWVKVDGNKIGKFKILKKAHAVASFKLPPKALRVCLKNQMTDFNYCSSVIYPKIK